VPSALWRAVQGPSSTRLRLKSLNPPTPRTPKALAPPNLPKSHQIKHVCSSLRLHNISVRTSQTTVHQMLRSLQKLTPPMQQSSRPRFRSHNWHRRCHNTYQSRTEGERAYTAGDDGYVAAETWCCLGEGCAADVAGLGC
jgi:hypothetical protein